MYKQSINKYKSSSKPNQMSHYTELQMLGNPLSINANKAKRISKNKNCNNPKK